MRTMRAAMAPQRLTLGIGLTILLVIGAVSIAMDVKSRDDAAWVDHTLGVLNKISDLHLLIRRAESAARGFGLLRDQNLAKEFKDTSAKVPAALDELTNALKDSPSQRELLEATRPL